jgi:hypothetical protein
MQGIMKWQTKRLTHQVIKFLNGLNQSNEINQIRDISYWFKKKRVRKKSFLNETIAVMTKILRLKSFS